MTAARPGARVRRVLSACLVTVVGLAGGLLSAPTASTAPGPTEDTASGLYVVLLSDAPPAAYRGSLPGYPATRPKAGERFAARSPESRAYRALLRERQDALLGSVGSPEVVYRYSTAVNGFAARLDEEQVKRLRATRGVLLVERSRVQPMATVDSPGHLGLTGARGVWEQRGGPEEAGSGVVVGVVDTGIWPENPSFAGLPAGAPRLRGFRSACQTGERWDAQDCNDKIVAARFFVEGFGRDNVAQAEYLSPRDYHGHGSHVASVAAGNHGVGVAVAGQRFGRASGMAPAARIASYKACWAAPDPADDGCATADAVAAIDRAVADGVDVLNFSVTGTTEPVTDAVGIAFLNAAAAGVFVTGPAGNRGPEPGTVGHPSPWMTTVAASTHRLFAGQVVLGDGTALTGAMVSDADVETARLVDAVDAAASGVPTADARLCRPGSLDAATARGSIVVCDRGVVARVDKSAAVDRAGGIGMVLVNQSPGSTDADIHSVPTVHLDDASGKAVSDYLAREGDQATARLEATAAPTTQTPLLAGFSARGPSAAFSGDLLKPDVTAPGVEVLAAVSPQDRDGDRWGLRSGTSVSAAHVAGLAALVRGVHPGWSPAEIKSAMVTTATGLAAETSALGRGAGLVAPEEMLDPGLVFPSRPAEWWRFLAGSGFRRTDGRAVATEATPPSMLNLPSVALGSVTGPTRVTRRVTNVSDRTESYHATVEGLEGLQVRVRPQDLTLAPGQTGRFRVRVVPLTDAVPQSVAEGTVTWTGSAGHDVRMPVVVRRAEVAVPDEVSGSGGSGSIVLEGTAGAGPAVPVSVSGLVATVPTRLTLSGNGFDPSAPAPGEDAAHSTSTVPEGTEAARFRVVAARPEADVDLYVYREGELVASSVGSGGRETVTLERPRAGDYDVYVVRAGADTSPVTADFLTWVVSPSDAQNLRAGTGQITAGVGEEFELVLRWSRLSAAHQWFGVLRFGSTGSERTFVTID